MDKVTIKNPKSFELSKDTLYHTDRDWSVAIASVPSAVIIECEDAGKTSDGYHTFDQLYHQRLILSAALAKNNPCAWKSKLHHDGKVPFDGGWFIMGWLTGEGYYTYHYELKDWDLFECQELPYAPEWDGHTADDVDRLLTLPTVMKVESNDVIKLRLNTDRWNVEQAHQIHEAMSEWFPDNKVLTVVDADIEVEKNDGI